MSDDLPVGSRGGMSIKHFFPVDGEYDILVELQKGNAQEVRKRTWPARSVGSVRKCSEMLLRYSG
jgi:hypothetical protein